MLYLVNTALARLATIFEYVWKPGELNMGQTAGLRA